MCDEVKEFFPQPLAGLFVWCTYNLVVLKTGLASFLACPYLLIIQQIVKFNNALFSVGLFVGSNFSL